MKKYLVVVTVLMLVTIIVASCVRSQTPMPNDIKEVVITLERTVCFGVCPEYKLTVYGNGTVVYEGRRFVKNEGIVTTTISEDKIRQLIAEFQKIDYFALEDSYEERMATDMPSAFTSLTVGGKTKAVRHYHGDLGAPEELTELEDWIDEVVNSGQWVR